MCVCVCVCMFFTGEGLFHTKQFSDGSRVSENSAQFSHYLPGEGLSPVRPSTSDTKHKPRLLPGHLNGYKLEVPVTSSLGLIHFLEWLTELTFLFFHFWPRLEACGFLVPQPGIEPGPWQRKLQVLTTGLPGNFSTQEFVWIGCGVSNRKEVLDD